MSQKKTKNKVHIKRKKIEVDACQKLRLFYLKKEGACIKIKMVSGKQKGRLCLSKKFLKNET